MFLASKPNTSRINSLTSLALLGNIYYILLLFLVKKAGRQGEGMRNRLIGNGKQFQSCLNNQEKVTSISLYLTGPARGSRF